MKHLATGVALIALASSTVLAQTDPTPMPPAEPVMVADAAPPPPPQMLSLNSGTPITLAAGEEVNSSTHREGDTFKLIVLNDVKVGDKVVIPKGTPATGEITWRTGKGAFGKSGKLEFSLRSINLNGTLIPVTGDYRQEGEGNTVATGVGVIAIGVFAGFITGKRARLPVGRELMAQLPQSVPFDANGTLSSSFDSKAAMATAEANTPLGKCRIAARALSSEKKRESAMEDCFSERME
jgi:hypothetical protein